MKREYQRDWKFYAAVLVVIGLMLAGILSQCAHAEDFVLSWGPPTERVDGTPMDCDTECASYRFWCEKANTGTSSIDETRPNSIAYDSDIFTKNWTGVGYCKAYVTDTEGRNSAWSNEAKVSPSPNPPGNMRRTARGAGKSFGPRYRATRPAPQRVYLVWARP